MALISITAISSKAQCFKNRQANEQPSITAGVMVDYSLHFFKSGFSGKSIHAGIWAQHLGVFAGYVESKLNDSTTARRDGAITIAVKVRLINDHVCVVPFFSAGTNNYQDFGIRAGVKLNDGIYLGLMASRTMHYGATIIISMNQNR